MTWLEATHVYLAEHSVSFSFGNKKGFLVYFFLQYLNINHFWGEGPTSPVLSLKFGLDMYTIGLYHIQLVISSLGLCEKRMGQPACYFCRI